MLRSTHSRIAVAQSASHHAGQLLLEVSPNDPVILAAVALGLAGIATLAGYVPARRARKVDPMEALGYE